MQLETCKKFGDFIVFNPYMSKFSKYKIQMPNQKCQIILIIYHISAKITKILCYQLDIWCCKM